uniref:Secreted protein n=2 Tax=Caenorhabditis tropicalis TaxID=1561998 RepID=A0A1I7UUC8_9PELO
MSNKFLLFSAFILVLVTVSSSTLMCLYGTTTQKGTQTTGSTSPIACPNSIYCMKIYQKDKNYKNTQVNSYGCGTGACTVRFSRVFRNKTNFFRRLDVLKTAMDTVNVVVKEITVTKTFMLR